jgi:hypothetical protein
LMEYIKHMKFYKYQAQKMKVPERTFILKNIKR